MWHSATSSGSTPAVCALSTIKSRLCSSAMAPISLTGIIVPVTLEACKTQIMRVLGWISRLMSSGSKLPSELHFAMLHSIPFRVRLSNGRAVALCSILVVITWSPGLRIPFNPVLRASVMFRQKAIRVLSGILNKDARASLVSNSMELEVIVFRLAPLPGLPPI